MKKLLTMALLLAAPSMVFALAEERFGNAPVGNQPEWAQGVLDVVNLQSRVYSYWVNGNENFFYQGRAQALNEALRKYAAVKSDVRRLILLPGTGKQRSFSKGDIAYDWHFHVPSGIYRAVAKRTHAEMTVYINAKKPRELDDRKSIAKWLGDLDNDFFPTRERARIALEKLGNDAKPFLRDALKPQQTLETRRRIEALLLRLSDMDASDLEVPKELQVITPTDLVAIHLEGLKHADSTAQAMAINDLSRLAGYSDLVIPAIAKMLHKDNAQYPRQMAAVCLASIGAEAKTAIPALKEAINDANDTMRKVFADSIAQLEKAKAEPVHEEEVVRRRAILNDIDALKKTAAK